MIAYHNGLPAWTNGSALTLPSSATTCSIAAARAMFREDSNSDYLPYTFNRSMSAFNKVNKFMVTPFEKPNMNQKGIVNGGIQYFYVER